MISPGEASHLDQDRHARIKGPAAAGEYLSRSRTSQEHPRRAFIQTPLLNGICNIFMQGPLREDFTRISTRSSDKGLYKIMQEPSRTSETGLHEDLHKIFLCKDL